MNFLLLPLNYVSALVGILLWYKHTSPIRGSASNFHIAMHFNLHMLHCVSEQHNYKCTFYIVKVIFLRIVNNYKIYAIADGGTASNMEGSCKYIEQAVADSRQGVVL
jgi:hypothetical protein